MATVDPNLTEMRSATSETFRAHWRLFLLQGATMVVLGVLALAASVSATISVDIYLGWLFLISGVVGLAAMFSVHKVPGFSWSLVTALLSLVVGGLLLWNPLEGVLSLTIVLTAFFIVEGIFQAVAAFTYRDGMRGIKASRTTHEQ